MKSNEVVKKVLESEKPVRDILLKEEEDDKGYLQNDKTSVNTRVVAVVRGGLLSEVYSDAPIDLELYDFDDEDADNKQKEEDLQNDVKGMKDYL